MTTRPSKPSGLLVWAPLVGAAAVVVGVIYNTGAKSSQLDDNTRRILILETKSEVRDAKLDGINERLTRIEAKLEILVPSQSAQKK